MDHTIKVDSEKTPRRHGESDYLQAMLDRI